jgi:molecular chaperone GrpE
LAAEPPDKGAALLVTISESVERLATSSEHYHARAEQREGVIDHLHSEVDRLRRGERRGLLRPLLVEICRLRNDLLRQADDLPADFDADRARLLLRSYADSVELALEDSGVVSFAPEMGDRFEPRLHRRVGGEPTGDPALAGGVARVRRSGYLDVDTNTPIARAEVVLFAPAGAGPPGDPDDPSGRSEPGEGTDGHGAVAATGERKEL